MDAIATPVFEPGSLPPDCALNYFTKKVQKCMNSLEAHARTFVYFRAKDHTLAGVKNVKLFGKSHYMFLFTFLTL